MSNYYGCKGEAINLIPHYLIDIIYKTVKPSHLEKLKIIQNINNLMFQIVFIFSDWILIKQTIVFSTPFCLGETDFQKILPGVFSGELIQCIFYECEYHKFKKFSHTWWNTQVRENSTCILKRDKTLSSLKKYERMYSWG